MAEDCATLPADGRSMFTLVLIAEPGEIAPEVRLRRLLKAALRRYGFRALRVRATMPEISATLVGGGRAGAPE